MEEKRGRLADVIYHNRDNGYTIAVMENDESEVPEQFTAVGHLAAPDRGRVFVLEGEWKTHPSYGEQFAFRSWREEMPTTAEGVEDFLASGLLKGIGKKTAAAIVRRFGSDALRVMEEAPERLAEVEGIGRVKAASIAEAFAAHRAFAAVVLYFQQFGISSGLAMKLYKTYGGETIRAVEEDPYRLVDDVFGIGFRTADKIAAKLGKDPRAPQRLQSGIRFTLGAFAGEGHTFLPQKQLCETAGELMEVSADEVYESLVAMAFEGAVQIDKLEGRAVVYLPFYHLAEQRVCRKLIDLERASLQPIKGAVDQLIEATERSTGIELSRSQKDAVKASLERGVTVITGGPGTGKTTIINTIMAILRASGIEAVIAAPTGRAAKRITETSGYPASTIHRLLEYYYSEGEDAMRFGKNAEDPLDAGAVIIDEASMIDILLMKGLTDALRPGTRLVLVGDADQLPSVGPGNVLRDIIESEAITAIKLTEIFRQARESLIVVNAHRIDKGEYPEVNERETDFFLLRRKTEKEMAETIKDLCQRRLPAYFAGSDMLRDVQVLTPVRKGALGSIQLNRELQEILNPPAPERKERKSLERVFREGDKVMQIRNNYRLAWKRMDDFTEGQGIFNGDCGFIQTIDAEYGELTVVFDENKFVTYEFSQLDELELAYAITVHKSQGSEFPIVILPVSWFPPMLATRNLLYTAVTRAKSAVVLVGSEDKMRAMVDNNRIVERFSGLRPRLQSFLEQGSFLHGEG